MKSVAAVNWPDNLDNGEMANAWVTYKGTTKNLSVYLTYDKNPVFPNELTVSYSVDLSEYLPPYVSLGFSASTGVSIELHNLLSWEFNSSTLREISPSPSPVPSQLRPPFVANGSPPTEIKSRVPSFKVIGPIVGGAAVVLGLLCFLWWKRITGTGETSNRQVMERNEMLQVVEGAAIDNNIELDQLDRAFSYSELVIATDNFGEHRKLGRGGFGEVYRGHLEDPPLEVAVKRIFNPSAVQGKKQYASEVKTISQLRHRNVVHLIGWCHDQGHLLLVYELVPNGSLDSYLFGDKGPLSWVVRYRIARGLASALLYLHEDGKRCVLHRDVKTSNVMLDSGFNAMLGDFGMARLVDHDMTLQTTDVGGTRGYLAPECYSTGKASKQSDVFSFGVVALEIACGRKVIDFTAEVGKVALVNWVWDLYGAGKILEAADERLKMEFDLGEMERLMVVGLWCAHPDHLCRPSMRQVIAILNSEEAPLPNLPQKMPVAIYVTPPSVCHEVIENDGSALLSEGCSSDSSKLLASSSNSNTISALSHKSGP
ncbi:L-type lectin-domain containing receptor kinase IX.1 [Acorus gramineus]|uniref:L-type lectin-domain containing receptor kinase IX.1 n=1 Tax=Acorus gramineus TaxID=55184 RepID=A0AAV9BHJ6_ACOGR|nr:L-type lectin-domain containing receptor kinase IX.1 [Acorus gramineus]